MRLRTENMELGRLDLERRLTGPENTWEGHGVKSVQIDVHNMGPHDKAPHDGMKWEDSEVGFTQ